jgi:hypothetical protein
MSQAAMIASASVLASPAAKRPLFAIKLQKHRFQIAEWAFFNSHWLLRFKIMQLGLQAHPVTQTLDHIIRYHGGLVTKGDDARHPAVERIGRQLLVSSESSINTYPGNIGSIFSMRLPLRTRSTLIVGQNTSKP